MKGKIYQILPMVPGQRIEVKYRRVMFEMEDGSWARTDIVPGYRNEPYWRPHLIVGNVLGSLQWKNEKEHMLDADAHPVLLKPTDFNPPAKPQPKPDPQMALGL